MDKPIAAVIQHKLIITKSLDELLAYYHRFLRIARTKGAKLAVFPEFSGLAVGVPMFPGWRNALLKEAATPKTGLFPRLKGMLAGGAANVMRADLQKTLRLTLSQMPESLFDVYVSVFSDLARQYEMTLVAGSLYHYDVENDAIRHTSYVFGPDGSLLGQQAQVVLDPETLDVVQPGEGWQAIDTPVGRIGLLFGYEALYPEPARVLAYQGAEMLLTIAATKRPAVYHKIRQGALARCQENQLYGLVSFLVGPDPFAGDEEPVFMGKSAVFAPLDFTPRFTGVMTELGSAQAEGVITAELDYPALRELWSATETPLRREMPLEQVGLLAQVYGRALTLDASQQLPPVAEDAVTEADAPLLAAEEMTLPQDENPEDASQDESGEENVLSLVTPILPTEPPIILSETPIDADDAAPVEEVEAVEPPPAPIEDESITTSAEEETTSEA
jgi:predicted amidohydrolase